MASKFGLSLLRSRFDDWRANFRWSSKSAALNDQANLSNLIERHVIPQLIAESREAEQRLDTKAKAQLIGTSEKRPISPADVDSFARLSITAEAPILLDFIDNCLATGNSVEDVYVSLLAPAARKLGQGWEEDEQDFVDVTMGLWRIQEVLRELSMRVPPPPRERGQGQHSALFTPIPKDQHSLGALMVSECFQRSGWNAEALIDPTQSELLAKVADWHFDVIGLTITNDCPTKTISGLVSTIRSVSKNPGIRVMIGGRVANSDPELVTRCGADATATDAVQAVEVANSLVSAKLGSPQSLV